MEEFQPKLIYLARRHPSLTRAQFTSRWREHGRLGMSLPRWANIARYVHCDLEPSRDKSSAVLEDYDGIGLIWHKSPAHRKAHLADSTSKAVMEADEADTFSVPIAEVCLVAREELVQRPPPPGNWKLTVFLRQASTAARLTTTVGHVRNHTLPSENGRAWGLSFGLVEEFWFRSRREAEAEEEKLKKLGLVTLGREVQLYP